MRTLKEQIENKCIHFNGVMNKACEIGITYESVRVGRPYQFPCVNTGGHCDKCQFPTEQEVLDRISGIDDMATKSIEVYAAIKQTKKTSGTIPCSCTGQIHFATAEVNGHIRAKCDNCGFSFME